MGLNKTAASTVQGGRTLNVRAFDLLIRSITTAVLALLVLIVASYEVIEQGSIDTSWGTFVGLVLGVYFGAHINQNGASARARRDAVLTAELEGVDPPRDDGGILKDATTPRA